MSSTLNRLSLLFVCARMGIKTILADWILMLGAYLVYAALMILYAGIVRLIPEADLAPYGYTHEQMIWYLGTAEYVVFCGSDWWYKEWQNDVLSSQIHLSFLRPVPNALMRVGVWCGESVGRMLGLAPAYLVLMFSLTGGYWPGFAAMAGVFSGIPFAVLIMACGSYMIGGSCLWFIQAEPAFWLWQKAIFLLGAMLWPMSFYPGWAQTFMWFTPFPGILSVASNWALGVGGWLHLLGFAHQFLWAMAFVLLVRRFEKKILRHIQETGA